MTSKLKKTFGDSWGVALSTIALILIPLLLAGMAFWGCTRIQEEGSLTFSPDAVPDNDITSAAINIGHSTRYAVFCSLTGTDSPSGDLILRTSLDGTNMETYDTQSVGGAAATKLWNVYDASYKYFDVFWDSTSGGSTDTLTCSYTVKN